MAKYGHFWQLWPKTGQFLTVFSRKSSKMTKKSHFLTSGVTHHPKVWNFWSRNPIQATNFQHPPIWDGLNYVLYFRLSSPPVYMVVWSKLKTDLRIVHPPIGRKGSENPPESRGPEANFTDFSWFSGQNGWFLGLESVVLARTVRNGGFLVIFTKKWQKTGILAGLFGTEAGVEMPENGVFYSIFRPPRGVYRPSFPIKSFLAWWTISGPGPCCQPCCLRVHHAGQWHRVHTAGTVPKTT